MEQSTKNADLCGKRYGRLTVIKKSENYISPGGHKCSTWLCKCDCGNEIVVRQSSLKCGYTLSCGCYARENKKKLLTTHGFGNEDRLYRIWSGSKNRCLNPKNRDYYKYGGRGITYFEPWARDFEEFRRWALSNGYKDNLTLDRKDNDKGYSPDNCRWVTYEIQESNRRNNHYIELDGVKKTISQWAREFNISPTTICDRIRAGLSEKDAVTKKVRCKNE